MQLTHFVGMVLKLAGHAVRRMESIANVPYLQWYMLKLAGHMASASLASDATH